MEIMSIQVGVGDNSHYYATNSVSGTRITEYYKPIEYVEGRIYKKLLVYRVFRNETLITEIQSNLPLTIDY